MSTGKFGLQSMKNGVYRTKHKVLTKFGKANATVDLQYDQEWARFDGFTAVVLNTQKHLLDFTKALTQMSLAETNLAECWASIFDTGSPMYNIYAKNVVYVGQMEAIRIQMCEDLKRDIDEPLDQFNETFKVIKKRDKERTRRKVDSDRLLYDYEKLQRKGKDAENVEPLRIQSEAMALYYERLNTELKRDLPLLIDDRSLFYTPLFANWIFHCHEYYRQAFQNLGPLAQLVSNIDFSQMHRHPSVITSEEASMYNVEIKDCLPDDLDDAAMMSADPNAYQAGQQSVAPIAYGQPPYGQPNYGPPPGSQYGAPPYGQPPPSGYGQPQPGGYGQPGYPPQGGYNPGPQYGAAPATNRPYQPPAGGGGGYNAGPQGGGFPPASQGRGPPRPGGAQQARALYLFQGTGPGELTFNQGDVLTVFGPGEPGWLDCEVQGRRGLAPANYVEML